MTSSRTGIGEEIDLAELWADPYPSYRRIRDVEPVCWVPAANRYLVTRYEDVSAMERDQGAFTAAEDGSLMYPVMGVPMLRQDGEAHRRRRAAAEPPYRARFVREHWSGLFQKITDELLDDLLARSPSGRAELVSAFCEPFAGRCLAALLGFDEEVAVRLGPWSQAMMDGVANYGGDPAVDARATAASAAIDEALEAVVPRLTRSPDASAVSSMLHHENGLSLEEIRSDVKMMIGGGLNEPRDALSVAVAALCENPDQLAMVKADPSLWRQVTEETFRWVAPIGMFPRQTAKAVTLGGTDLPAGAPLGVVVASANRDERVFADPDRFDITRESNNRHVAFSVGPHHCLGAWVARQQLAEGALPTLFGRLEGLRLDEHDEAKAGGWVFRGMVRLPVAWG